MLLSDSLKNAHSLFDKFNECWLMQFPTIFAECIITSLLDGFNFAIGTHALNY